MGWGLGGCPGLAAIRGVGGSACGVVGLLIVAADCDAEGVVTKSE